MSNKFKVGDKVKVKNIKDWRGNDNKIDRKLKNKTGKIISINTYFDYPICIQFDGTDKHDAINDWLWSEENIELCMPEIVREYYIIVNKKTNEYVQWDGQLVLDVVLADLYPDKEKAKKDILELDSPEDFEIKKLIVTYEVE